MKRIVFTAAFVLFTRTVCAHVGSPNVFLRGDAGPYPLIVSVIAPSAIPGMAKVDVLSRSADVSSIRLAVTTLSGSGSRTIPLWEPAQRTDTQEFATDLWLMVPGALRILVKARGLRGDGVLSVPVAAYPQKVLEMSATLKLLTAAGVMLLALMLPSIVCAGVRVGGLPPGAEPSPADVARGRVAFVVASVFAVTAVAALAWWWNVEARTLESRNRRYSPPRIVATIKGNVLDIHPVSDAWIKQVPLDALLLDHGHPVHLFLIQDPAMQAIYHLHPAPNGPAELTVDLPDTAPGKYRIFADVVDRTGFPWTMVGAVALPSVKGVSLRGDDSAGTLPPIAKLSPLPDTFVLPDGSRIVWRRPKIALKERVPTVLSFVAEGADGLPLRDLEPYMGMAAHAEIVKSDFTVFAHIHPNGSVSMASIAVADSRQDLSMADGMPIAMLMSEEPIDPVVSFPYGFPKSGRYRIFIQIRHRGRVETAEFDTNVE